MEWTSGVNFMARVPTSQTVLQMEKTHYRLLNGLAYWNLNLKNCIQAGSLEDIEEEASDDGHDGDGGDGGDDDDDEDEVEIQSSIFTRTKTRKYVKK